MKRNMASILIYAGAIVLFLINSSARTATISASSCALSAVQAAVNSASPGDTILVPSGNCSWSGGVSLTKGVTVLGAGKNSTIITQKGANFFSIKGNGSGNFRISNMKFAGTSTSGTDVFIDGGWTSLRIDNIIWNTGSARGIWLGNNWWWDCKFYGTCYSHQKALFDNITYKAASSDAGHPFLLLYGRDHKAWAEDDGFGTDNFVFIEDSTFAWDSSFGYLTDTEHAGRYVARYNTLTNGGIYAHDLGSTPSSRGGRAVEVYNNSLTCNLSSSICTGNPGINSTRGGTGLFYGNKLNGYGLYSWPMIFRVAYNNSFVGGGYCSQTGSRKVCSDVSRRCAGGSRALRPCYSDSDCPSSTCKVDYSCNSNSDCRDASGNTGLCMQIDGLGRTGSEAPGWPCRDQPGRGKDDAATGQQASSPIYWWNNTVDGTTNKPMMVGSAYTSYVQLGRDYCNHSPSTSCGSKGAWTYNPYSYPHPWRSGETPPPSGGPSAPTNFKVVN